MLFFWGNKSRIKKVFSTRGKSALLNSGQKEEHLGTVLLFGFFYALLTVWFIETINKESSFGLLGQILYIFLLFVLYAYVTWFYYRDVALSAPKVLFLGAIHMLLLAAATILIRKNLPISSVPLFASAILLGISFPRRLGLFSLMFQFSILIILKDVDKLHLTSMFLVSIFIVQNVFRIRTRTKLMKIGFLCGILSSVIMAIMYIAFAPHLDNLSFINDALFRRSVLWVNVNGIATGFIITGLLPYIEKIFGITTDLSLLELSDLNQPLLKRLSLEAPGTYHHSLSMANLAEAAAEAIGANSLLARTGAYYHDIGKLTKPEYFTENESIKGMKHNKLTPSMSALIIKAHVKDGIELGEYFGLSRKIIDFIPEHHGTTLMEYFYYEAKELQKNDENNDMPEVSEETFRYPGPKPRSKETAIVHLADIIEAASRTIKEATPAKIEGFVHDALMKRLLDGQLDECPLSMGEIKLIETQFVRVLSAIMHARIKYPDQADEKDLIHNGNNNQNGVNENKSYKGA